MAHNILITGASGYLGGTLLARWKSANLPDYDRLYALVRTDKQAEAVKQYGAKPLIIDLNDSSAVKKALIDARITIVYYLIDAFGANTRPFIEALAEVKEQSGNEVHFLFTTGAKMFSSHAGAPTEHPLLDTDPKLYDIQVEQMDKTPHELFKQALRGNNTVVELAERLGVRSYIFAPCIVYGKGEGFGNPISIQTVAIIKAAKALRKVYRVDKGRPVWPVCHVIDNSMLYITILRGILNGEDIGHGKNGYFLASPGSVAWDDIYHEFARVLKERGVVDEEEVKEADEAILQKMGQALGCPANMVGVQLGGLCKFTAQHGQQIGWKPQFEPDHVLEAAKEEVDLVLKNLKE